MLVKLFELETFASFRINNVGNVIAIIAIA